MPNVTLYLVAALVALAMLAGAYIEGRSDERKIVTSEYAQRDLKAQAEYTAKLQAIEEVNRAKEANWQAQFVSASRTYEGKVKENAKALDIALTSGRLYDRFATTNQACGDSTAKTATDPIPTRQAGAELSEQFDKFLKSEASRADKVVLDLNLCIGTLEGERQ